MRALQTNVLSGKTFKVSAPVDLGGEFWLLVCMCSELVRAFALMYGLPHVSTMAPGYSPPTLHSFGSQFLFHFLLPFHAGNDFGW